MRGYGRLRDQHQEFRSWFRCLYHHLGLSLGLAVVTPFMAVHLVVLLCRGEGSWHRPGALVFQQQGTLLHPEVAHLTPVFTP